MALRSWAWALLGLAVTASCWAAAPPGRLTAEQKAKLAERDRLERSLGRFLEDQEYDKAIDVAERIAKIEQQVLGETHPRALGRCSAWRAFARRFRNSPKR